MSIVLDGTANTVTPLNGALGATTPSTVVATTVVASSTIKGATTIAVGNATPSVSGAGITFPATQSASTDANTLDDYEEGTWTPTQGAGLTVVGAFVSYGKYTKIGNLVTLTGIVGAATSVAFAAGNAVVCGGIPFTNPAPNNQVGNGLCVNEAATASAVVSIYGTNLYSQGAMAATKNIYFSISYLTNT